MSVKLKMWLTIVGVILLVLIFIAGGFYGYDLMKYKRELKAQNEELQLKIKQAESSVSLLKSTINVGNKVKIVYKQIPGQTTTLSPPEFTLQVDDTLGRWHFTYPPAVLSANTLIDNAVEPYKTAVDDCMKAKTPGKPKIWDTTQRVEVFVGGGVPTFSTKVIYQPIKFGGKSFGLSPAVILGGSMDSSQKLYGEVSGGIIINLNFGR